ncbi:MULTISPECIES: hypothetical protein [unclassified Microbulbifer]|uniref:XRE family transcriptional regulator n=1 Tax=Microbulbifer spongiae TaxID=2944933 RepID=A0ABY9E5Z8_9GAMM|nr:MULTISPECIES: hypothetical protein [unclassified Microbulbifer]MDP5208318.1 hypothetical protein [Microbulbifer sp. 2205BS26-8]WKD48444.1 hypothetical protein M8T91_10945 [Microbulbifer sp. MI-G]
MDTGGDLLEKVRAQLRERRGQWKEISERSGVPYFTLIKIANGATENPRWRTLARLSEQLSREPATPQ